MSFELPSVPAPHRDFVSYVGKNQQVPFRNLVKPYNEYEAKLREGFAQHRDHALVQDPLVNAVPIFSGHEHVLKIRERDPEMDPEAGKYIMPLLQDTRKAEGSPAVAQSVKEFKNNFNLFSEQSLVDLDWNNVVAAGSSVVTAMLPVPQEFKSSKKALREYYHQQLAPSSDVDLFIWGLDEEAAVKKIAQIEECVRNTILSEITTVRTKNAITIVSQYPTRHIQIVLRLYKSVSEILTGFDVDCSCFAYDGHQVYATPRGVASFCSQTNVVDLTRRSPSYETRLAKYARRGFEIFFADFDRNRIDPTLYDRSFVRTMGLARLLILERLPTESDRTRYQNQRRKERGRPMMHNTTRSGTLPGNMKDDDPDDIPDWDLEKDVADYHTFTIPYGPKYTAKRIERLLFIKDMLLNAEWNRDDNRKVDLHRHPCFLGDVASITQDCCGECPEPRTDEERDVAEEERKVFVHGDIAFMKDDPGRQAIGSFNPLTAHDWTEMAYLGNTQELCRAITEGDLEFVKSWCAEESNDVNQRDHTGRMPLHRAVICGQLEIMKVLVANGARIISRVADGFTALHMAAALGRADMIKVLAEKSEENEELESKKEDARKEIRRQKRAQGDTQMEDADESDAEMIDADEADDDETMTQGSFVKVKDEKEGSDDLTDEDSWGPDVYNINVLAWDTPVSPLHVAILGGHLEAIDTLVSSFGADVLLPVKLKSTSPSAILNLVLASRLLDKESSATIKKLVSLGAKPSQSDVSEVSGLHGAVLLENVSAMKAMLESDRPSSEVALNHVTATGAIYHAYVSTPLLSALRAKNDRLINALLDAGARPVISFEEFREAYLRSFEESTNRHDHAFKDEEIRRNYKIFASQPIITAAMTLGKDIVTRLLDLGADINTIDSQGARVIEKGEIHSRGSTPLDIVRGEIRRLRSFFQKPMQRKFLEMKTDEEYLRDLVPGSYKHTVISRAVEIAKVVDSELRRQEKENARQGFYSDYAKKSRVQKQQRIEELEELEGILLKRGAKGFYELYPRYKEPEEPKYNNQGWNWNTPNWNKRVRDEMESPYLEIEHTFTDPRMDEDKKAAYTRLFQATWEGDVETVKTLTLKPLENSDGHTIPPLEITVSDCYGLNPLAIAVVRGSIETVQTILDIAVAQYNPPDTSGPRRRFRIHGSEDTQDYEDSDDGSNGTIEDIEVTSELINDKFTIEDLGQLGQSVGSRTSPLDHLMKHSPIWAVSHDLSVSYEEVRKVYNRRWRPKAQWQAWQLWKEAMSGDIKRNWDGMNLIEYATHKGDLNLVKFLLQAAEKLSRKGNGRGVDTSPQPAHWSWSLDENLHHCIRHGKMEIVEELISEYGIGLPLEEMISEIDIPEEEREKPEYYQGLKLYGKHKKAWAAQAAGQHNYNFRDWRQQSSAPFLKAVYLENRRTVEFWQSDACIRMYNTFGQRKQDYKQIELVAKKNGGWDRTVSKWLGLRRNLTLHCAVLRGSRGSQKSEILEMTEYLMSSAPESLNTKSLSGHDPLWLAFYHRQVGNAKLFIDAGADQTTRDRQGLNLMHALLYQGTRSKAKERDEDIAKIESLIKMVDPLVLPSLFTDRCAEGPSGVTPFVLWLYQGNADVELFKVLKKHMPQEVFSMFDGSGQTPVHTMMIQNPRPEETFQMLLDDHPELLQLENGAGQTAVDLSASLYLRQQTQSAPVVMTGDAIIDSPYSAFEQRNSGFRGDGDWQFRTHLQLKSLVAKYESVHGKNALKRKMISVRDASEVAKRLAEKQSGVITSATSGTSRPRRSRYDQDETHVDEVHDEVERWFQKKGINWSA